MFHMATKPTDRIAAQRGTGANAWNVLWILSRMPDADLWCNAMNGPGDLHAEMPGSPSMACRRPP
jgi:hypothetical protein